MAIEDAPLATGSEKANHNPADSLKRARAGGSSGQWVRFMANRFGASAMEQPGLHDRHRDKNGEISRKHGNTLIGTLRKVYGHGFAPGCSDDAKLSDALESMHEHSLSMIVRDHHSGELDGKIKNASSKAA